MKFSIITPNFNGETFLEETILSVLGQKDSGVQLEYIVVDGMSSDGSIAILEKYRDAIDILVIESDTGPANAINKGFARATGDVAAWLNADDIYYPGTLARVEEAMKNSPSASFCFGKCPIIDEGGVEIRHGITRFKEFFFPISSRFVFQSINYVSQPALFFRRDILDDRNSYLREDLVAAWDYEFFLRLWHYGDGVAVPGDPLAAFRWHSGSISGQFFRTQFKEELDAAGADAGRWAVQTILHHGVRWGIVAAYSGMSVARKLRGSGIKETG